MERYEWRATVRIQTQNSINKKWDDYMKDAMVVSKDPVTGAQPLMTQVFYHK